jgi:hypothetical protein
MGSDQSTSPNATDTTASKHDGYIDADDLGFSYTAGCSCGWTDDTPNTQAMAVMALTNHYQDPGPYAAEDG